MHKLFYISRMFICFSCLFISGCVGFKEKFKPEDAVWSQQNGNKTLIVRGYFLTSKNRNEIRCGSHSGVADLMPDTPYFRDWMRILRVPAIAWKVFPSQKAEKFIHYTKWNPDCVYIFNNLPPGHWLLMINIRPFWHATCMETKDIYGVTGSECGKPDLLPDYMFVPLVIKPEDTVIKKNVVMDYAKRKDRGWFSIRRQMAPGEVYDWTEPSKIICK